MNKILKRTFIVASSFLLCACQSNRLNSSTISPATQPEGIYTKLMRAISSLNNFSSSGTLEYAAYDLVGGTTLEQAIYLLEIDLADESYYYSENDLATGEVIFEERFSKNENGKFVQETLDYSTNLVDKIVYTDDYDEVMDNPLLDIEVQDLNPIQGQLNWYNLTDFTIADAATYFLTGYDTINEGALSVAQYAIHYDGEKFDQMRILVEGYDDELSPTYCEQYLFTLQLSQFGNAVTKEIEPYETTSDHSALQIGLNELARAKNMTVKVSTQSIDGQTIYDEHSYMLDFENYIFLDPMVFTKNIYENGEVVSTHQCYSVYKQVGDNIDLDDDNTNNDGTLMIYDLDAETNEIIATNDFNKYYGTNSNYTFISLIPYFNLVAAACYKNTGDMTFKPYITTYDYATAAFIPFGASYAMSSLKNNMTIYVSDNSIDKVELTYSEQDESGFGTVNKADVLMYEDLDSTIIPEHILNLGE